MRDPLERLGAGPPEDQHSMEALRSHPFFANIRWDTLWDDPAPLLETGLVRRESAPADEWDDVGASWDELVSGPDGSEDEEEEDGGVEGSRPHSNAHSHSRSRAPGDDGIEWAPDAQAYISPPAIPPEEIGPHGEIPDYARESLSLAGAVNGVVAVDAVVISGGDVDDAQGKRAVGAGADSAINGSYELRFVPPRIDGVLMGAITSAGEAAGPGIGSDLSSGPCPAGPDPGKDNVVERGRLGNTNTEAGYGDGELPAEDLTRRKSAPLRVPRGMRDSYATSSSDGSPVERLGAALEAMGIHRGRLRTRSPTPARGSPCSAEAPDWYVSYFPIFCHCYTRGLNEIKISTAQGIGTQCGRDDAVPCASGGDGVKTAHVAVIAATSGVTTQAESARAHTDKPSAVVSQAAQERAWCWHQGRVCA